MALGGKRIKRRGEGKCLMPSCPNPMRENNLCGAHNVKDYRAKRIITKNFKRESLVREVAEITGLSQPKVSQIVNIILSQISQSLNKREKVSIRGFGVFDTHSRSVNVYGPRAYFRPAAALRYMVNHDYK